MNNDITSQIAKIEYNKNMLSTNIDSLENILNKMNIFWLSKEEDYGSISNTLTSNIKELKEKMIPILTEYIDACKIMQEGQMKIEKEW